MAAAQLFLVNVGAGSRKGGMEPFLHSSPLGASALPLHPQPLACTTPMPHGLVHSRLNRCVGALSPDDGCGTSHTTFACLPPTPDASRGPPYPYCGGTMYMLLLHSPAIVPLPLCRRCATAARCRWFWPCPTFPVPQTHLPLPPAPPPLAPFLALRRWCATAARCRLCWPCPTCPVPHTHLPLLPAPPPLAPVLPADGAPQPRAAGGAGCGHGRPAGLQRCGHGGDGAPGGGVPHGAGDHAHALRVAGGWAWGPGGWWCGGWGLIVGSCCRWLSGAALPYICP